MPHTGDPAFRCKTCGHIEGAAQAGDNAVPHACSVCGAGVTLNPKTKAFARELADPETTPERRAAIAGELGRLATTGDNEKLLHPENWEVLADLPPERHEELGLRPEQVARHAGKAVASGPVAGTAHSAGAADGAAAADRAG